MVEKTLSTTALIENVLKKVMLNPLHHAKWLNTLSYLENCGARKIASCEHPTLVREEMLKHAAEEFRHAHYLKKQITRASSAAHLSDYSLQNLLGGVSTLHYLNGLDLHACSYLKKRMFFNKQALRGAAYILVTYAIELRAQELYPIYDRLLRSGKSKVTVKSIALEEEEHLQQMHKELQTLPNGAQYLNSICIIERRLFINWLMSVEKNLTHPFPGREGLTN